MTEGLYVTTLNENGLGRVSAVREGIFQIERKWGDEVEKKKMICVKSFVYILDLTPMGPFTL